MLLAIPAEPIFGGIFLCLFDVHALGRVIAFVFLFLGIYRVLGMLAAAAFMLGNCRGERLRLTAQFLVKLM